MGLAGALPRQPRSAMSVRDGLGRTAMRVAVFDLDGTLADTGADLIAAANAALGAPLLDPERHRATAFAGGRAMLRAGLGPGHEDEVERLYPVLLDAYAQAIAVETRLYDGAEAALDAIEAAGWRLAICTNKPEGLARALLGALGVLDRFPVLLGADTLAWKKPDPRHLLEAVSQSGGVRELAVLVGDTVTDREAARAAGIPCVLVGFGPGEVETLGPEAIIGHFDELPAVLERLVPAG